jgi:hypothetical protein
MTYRYVLYDAPRTRAEMAEVLHELRCIDCESIYASFRTHEAQHGRPIPGLKKQRWFESSYEPLQGWLPFKELEPVRLLPPRLRTRSVFQLEFGVSQVTHYLARFGINEPTPGRNDLLALELYRRVEEPIDPFGGQRPSSATSNGTSFQIISATRLLREYLEHCVSASVGEPAYYNDHDSYFYSRGRYVASVRRVDVNHGWGGERYAVTVAYPYGDSTYCFTPALREEVEPLSP